MLLVVRRAAFCCLMLSICVPALAKIPYAQKIEFAKACEPGDQFVVSAVGDILLHGPLQVKAANAKDFRVLWKRMIPYFKRADFAYANLEGPTAEGVSLKGRSVRDPGHVFDQNVYTSYSVRGRKVGRFNYHPSLITDLVASGINILSTANNHSLDRYALGVDRTIDALDRSRADLAFTGTRKSGETERDRPWMAVTQENGMRIGWISCTYSTNGINDKKNQVLFCYKKNHRQRINEIIRNNRSRLDAIIVTPHWGSEYKHQPKARAVTFAKEVLDSGATAVIGAHPHVLQPMTKYRTRDGRETFIIYSLGNFVSNQGQLPRRASLVLFLGLTKTYNGTHINGVKFLPTVMTGHGRRKELLPTAVSSLGPKTEKHIFWLFNRGHAVNYSQNPRKVVTNDHCF